MLDPAHATTVALTSSLTSSPDLGGLAAFGKVAFALFVILVVIFVCAWLLRRFSPTRGISGKSLKIIATKAVGTKERVVVLEVEDTWLVLGVTATQINKLHELPAGELPSQTATPSSGSFSQRFATALKQNMRGGKR